MATVGNEFTEYQGLGLPFDTGFENTSPHVLVSRLVTWAVGEW
jgi:hypothetical protein